MEQKRFTTHILTHLLNRNSYGFSSDKATVLLLLCLCVIPWWFLDKLAKDAAFQIYSKSYSKIMKYYYVHITYFALGSHGNQQTMESRKMKSMCVIWHFQVSFRCVRAFSPYSRIDIKKKKHFKYFKLGLS